MKSPKLVRFGCCNDEILFTEYGQFKMCKCGSCGYDHGDGFVCRTIGDFTLIHFSFPGKDERSHFFEDPENGVS